MFLIGICAVFCGEHILSMCSGPKTHEYESICQSMALLLSGFDWSIFLLKVVYFGWPFYVTFSSLYIILEFCNYICRTAYACRTCL